MEDRKLKAKDPGESSVAKKSAVEEEAIVEMDECIWKELPKDLLERVVLRVPIATLIRFRLVCQKWNSMPFLQRCVPPELPWLYAVVEANGSDKGFGALYDPSVKKWHYSTHRPPYFWVFSKQATDGGLVCYPNFHSASFRVVNHLTRTSKVFPWPVTEWEGGTVIHASSDTFAVGLVDYPPRSGGYKIIWLERVGNYGVHDYSSDKCTTKQGRLPADIKLPCPVDSSGLAIGSVVYFLRNDPGGILSYDTTSGAWEQHLIPHPPNTTKWFNVTLVEGEMGRILLTGYVKRENKISGPCLAVCIWELDAQKRGWIEVDRMPSSYCSEFRFANVFLKCLCTRRLLMISLLGSRGGQDSTQIDGVFTYDVVSREWAKLPDCIPPGRTVRQRIYDGVGFFPCLSASP